MPSHQKSSGFTLIELLVVMVVVGLLVALATVTLGGNSLRRDLNNEAEKLYLLMTTASEQAILNNSEIGLLLEEEAYRFLIYDENTGTWEPSPERSFRERSVPEWLSFTKLVESDAPRLESAQDRVTPDVVFFSSGETTPFEFELFITEEASAADEYIHSFWSDGVGDLQWDYPGKQDQEAE